MLSFEPKHHQQIAEGECAGSWLPIFPPAGAKTDVFCAERMRESERIQNEGGTIVIIDPMGDKDMRSHTLIMGSSRTGMSGVALVEHVAAIGVLGGSLLKTQRSERDKSLLRVGRKHNSRFTSAKEAPHWHRFTQTRF